MRIQIKKYISSLIKRIMSGDYENNDHSYIYDDFFYHKNSNNGVFTALKKAH